MVAIGYFDSQGGDMKVLLCSTCKGEGQRLMLKTNDGDWYHGYLEYEECPDCQGRGMQLNFCPQCGVDLVSERVPDLMPEGV